MIEDPRIETLDAMTVAEVSALGGIPDGMDSHRLEGGRCAVFRYRGRADGFGDAARYTDQEWLPDSGFEMADREFFEVLPPSCPPDDPEATESIWIPIQEQNSWSDIRLSENGSSDPDRET